MLIYQQKPEEQYYELIESTGRPLVLVFGDEAEHWTAKTLEILEKGNIPVYFFPWGKVENLRLQLNATRFPLIQLWKNGTLVTECLGFYEETLEQLMYQYFRNT